MHLQPRDLFTVSNLLTHANAQLCPAMELGILSSEIILAPLYFTLFGLICLIWFNLLCFN